MSNTPVPPRGGKGRNQKGRPGSSQKGRAARQARQRRNRLMIYGAVVVAVAVVVVVVVLAVGGSSSGSLRHPAPAADVQKITNVPVATLTAASGLANLYGATNAASPSIKTLGSNGKPELLYIGAEFCPICATERWPMIVALSHFGTFTNLQETHSAVTDGNIPTWSFYGSTYTSQYFTFRPVENETNTEKLLETPTSTENQIWSTYFNGSQSFPFIDFDQKFVLATEQYPDTTLEGHSFQDILSAVGSNDNTIGNYVDGAAAVFTKYLCNMDGNQPANVCTAVKNVPAAISAQGSGGASSTPGGQTSGG
ncbi:MAG TPA: DUF929 family protein [Acidimicrobiales bacterium]|nr:DUF929 family protein [Acidimicrobiales bacterium]